MGKEEKDMERSTYLWLKEICNLNEHWITGSCVNMGVGLLVWVINRIFACVCGTENQTQSLVHGRQTLKHLGTSPAPIYINYTTKTLTSFPVRVIGYK
jgi:hypothetical protein